MSTHWLSKRTALDSATFVEDEGYTVVVTDMVQAWGKVEPSQAFMRAGDPLSQDGNKYLFWMLRHFHPDNWKSFAD